MAVYADISGGHSMLEPFYARLCDAILDHVAALPGGSWAGCLVAGNWNFVEHDGDCWPLGWPNHASLWCIHATFASIKVACSLVDVAGDGAYPRSWTHIQSLASSGKLYSRLDCLYLPAVSWSGSSPVSVPTEWSDHSLVWASCTVCHPCIQMAVPMPCMPDTAVLDASFWHATCMLWDTLNDQPSISLESWLSFKRQLLLGVASQKCCRL